MAEIPYKPFGKKRTYRMIVRRVAPTPGTQLWLKGVACLLDQPVSGGGRWGQAESVRTGRRPPRSGPLDADGRPQLRRPRASGRHA